jgi:hypothetical protein
MSNKAIHINNAPDGTFIGQSTLNNLTKKEIESYSNVTFYPLMAEIGGKKAKELFTRLIQYYVKKKTGQEPSAWDVYRVICFYDEVDTKPEEIAEYYIQAKIQEKEDDKRWLARYNIH